MTTHTFHIPVLGLGYSVDTPIKVAPYGISSVASIVDDYMIERMREFHTKEQGETFVPIQEEEEDFRSRRITAYLDLMDRIVNKKFEAIRHQSLEEGTELSRYFTLLPDHSDLKKAYHQVLDMPEGEARTTAIERLKAQLVKGTIDVNIMSKVDKVNKNAFGESKGDEFTDACASLRGFANSTLKSSLVLSAGMNPRLYSYLEAFDCFLPTSQGEFSKKIILKVSDFRSAFIQAKFLAKKGVWVSEFRIESGLNCGGHAFATDGFLLGPILDEFKEKKGDMIQELFSLYQSGLATRDCSLEQAPQVKITVQGGIGTASENQFLLDYYEVDATGWGSPFLLVPEVTNVDEETLQNLVVSDTEDYYVSNSSPLGVLFNNFRRSSAEKERLERIAKGRPGSPCKKRYLVSNTEFTQEPICTASREYQNLKIKQLQAQELSAEEYQDKFNAITEKLCLCEGLSTGTLVKHNLVKPKESKAVSICPGPNLAWFSKVYTLDEMVQHIYGKVNLLAQIDRPNMFINELNLYVEHYKKDVELHLKEFTDKKQKYLNKFRDQLLAGINYYKNIVPELSKSTQQLHDEMVQQLQSIELSLQEISVVRA